MDKPLNDAIELVKIGREYRNYPGSGGIWVDRNEGIANGNFEDWGLGRATAEILNAVVQGRLIPNPKLDPGRAPDPFVDAAERAALGLP